MYWDNTVCKWLLLKYLYGFALKCVRDRDLFRFFIESNFTVHWPFIRLQIIFLYKFVLLQFFSLYFYEFNVIFVSHMFTNSSATSTTLCIRSVFRNIEEIWKYFIVQCLLSNEFRSIFKAISIRIFHSYHSQKKNEKFPNTERCKTMLWTIRKIQIVVGHLKHFNLQLLNSIHLRRKIYIAFSTSERNVIK